MCRNRGDDCWRGSDGHTASLFPGTQELDERELLSQVDSVRYSTTLGTNALIERKGPRLGLLTTAGYKSSVPLSRAKGYGVGLPHQQQMDVPNAQRPDPIVPIPMIMEVRERIDYAGDVVMQLDEDDLRDKIRQLEVKLAELIRFGEENDDISTKVHRLSIALLVAPAERDEIVPACVQQTGPVSFSASPR